MKSSKELKDELREMETKCLELYVSDRTNGNNLSPNQQELLRDAADKFRALINSMPRS